MASLIVAKRRILSAGLVLAGTMLLAACDENGEFAFPGAAAEGAEIDRPTRSVQTEQGERDVERPDIFEVTDRGLWDGRPSLGGIWVAHPDVQDPERVIIRNPANGRSAVGALFRRERENPGPLLQVSSDAAEELEILAGAPTELSVVVLRREEVEEETPAEPEVNPVVASLAAPVSVEATPIDSADPIAGAAAAIDAAESTGGAAAAVALPAALPSDDDTDAAAAENTSDEVAVVLPPATGAGEADLSGPQIQIGVFSVQGNADGAAQRLREAGVPASVVVEQAGGRDVWRLVASPAGEDADAEATITQIKGLGFADAFLVESDDS